MPDLDALPLIVAASGLVVVGVALCRHAGRSRNRARLSHPSLHGRATSDVDPEPLRARGVARWLQRAGVPRAEQRRWIAAQVLCLLAGVVVGRVMSQNATAHTLADWAGSLPGGFGGLFVPVLEVMPWLSALCLAALPAARLSARRRALVASVERDLPVVLQLLATLGEAGLGLDAALARVLEILDARRPLSILLRGFQREVAGGVARHEALRRMAARADTPSLSIFTSAVVQAEQIGAGLSTTLRAQASDLADRDRERALMAAQALPAKLAFPLVICFLPALFAITLGPILLDFIELTEGVIGRS